MTPRAIVSTILLDTNMTDESVLIALRTAAAEAGRPLRVRPSSLDRHLGDRYRRVIHGLQLGRRTAELGLGPNSLLRVSLLMAEA